MNPLSLYILLLAIALIVVWDTVAMIRGGLPATISWLIWVNSKEAPIIPFIAGLVAGHLFWCACGGLVCK